MVVLAQRGVRHAERALDDWSRSVRSLVSRMVSTEAEQVSLWLPVAFGAGILGYFALRVEPPVWAGPLAASVLLALLALAWRRTSWRLVCKFGLAAALGMSVIQLHAAAMPPPEPLPARATVVEGRVIATEALSRGLRLTLAEATWEGRASPMARTVRIRLRDAEPTSVVPGDRVRIRALLRPPSAPAEPGAFDFQRAAFFAGQAGSGFALGAPEILSRSQTHGGDGVAIWFAALRADLVTRTRGAIPGPSGAIATALLTGQQTGIPDRDAQAMRDSGLTHLLSVSGLHVTIVMGMLFIAFRLAFSWSELVAVRLPAKGLALTLGLAGGVFYMGLTGSQVPMQRSVLMAAVVVLALALGRDPISLRAVGLAAVAVLAVNPAAILSPSFQMSFAAVAALVAGWTFMRARPGVLGASTGMQRRFRLFVLGLVGTSAIAGVATAPFAVFHFQQSAIYGVIANAVAVPLTSFFVMPAGILAMLLMPFGGEALALVPMGWGCAAILAVAHEVAGWPAASPLLPAMPGWGLACCTAGLLLFCLLRSGLRLVGLPLGLLGLLSPASHTPPDVLMSADAGVIAINHQGALHVVRSAGANTFPLETWQRRAGGLPLKTTACPAPYCMVGEVAVVPAAGTFPQALCGKVPLMVGRESLPDRCGSTITLDRFDAARNGPHAIWLSASGPVVVHDRDMRGERPWVPQRWRPASSDGPLAPRN